MSTRKRRRSQNFQMPSGARIRGRYYYKTELPDNFSLSLRKLICHYVIEDPAETLLTTITTDDIETAQWIDLMYNYTINLSKFDHDAICRSMSYNSYETLNFVTSRFSESFKPDYSKVMELWKAQDGIPQCMEQIIDRAIKQSGPDVIKIAVWKT